MRVNEGAFEVDDARSDDRDALVALGSRDKAPHVVRRDPGVRVDEQNIRGRREGRALVASPREAHVPITCDPDDVELLDSLEALVG